MRQLIHLNDDFDVEDFEEEITGIADPPMFLNDFKTKLVQYLANHRMEDPDEFSQQVDIILSKHNALSSTIDGIDGVDMEIDADGDASIDYDGLGIDAKIDVLYQLVLLCNAKSAARYRQAADKYEKNTNGKEEPEEDEDSDEMHGMRAMPIYECSGEGGELKEEYVMLQDARLYYLRWKYPKMNVASTRSEFINELGTNESVAEKYSKFEPHLEEWKCLTAGIYQFDEYVGNVKSNGTSENEFGGRTANRRLGSRLTSRYNRVISHDLRKRRQAQQRKRDLQMQYLLAHRKRSSRIVEMQKRKEERARKEREEAARLRAKEEARREARRRRRREKQLAEAEANARERARLRAEREAAERMKASSVERAKTVKQEETKHKHANNSKAKHWKFECSCGVSQRDYDDGTRLIECDRCNRWQHLACQPEDIQTKLEKNPRYKFRCSFCRTELASKAAERKKQHEEMLYRHTEREIAELEDEFAHDKRFQTVDMDYKGSEGVPIQPYSFKKAQITFQLALRGMQMVIPEKKVKKPRRHIPGHRPVGRPRKHPVPMTEK